MDDLKDVHVVPLPADSAYVKPFRLEYTQRGVTKFWDMLEVHDSVAVVIFNVTRKVLVLVKQFRPVVYYNSVPAEDKADGKIDPGKYPASVAFTLEFCAGIVDKDLSLDEIAQEEVLEECGYKVDPKDLHRVMQYRSDVGTTGSLQMLYYCEVTDDMKVNQGGGIGDEIIDVIEMTIPEAKELLSSKGPVTSPPSFLFGLSWFIYNRAPQYC